MDSKVWDVVGKLTNDKSTYRNWRMKLKSAFKQVTKVRSHKDIMTFLEQPEYIKSGFAVDRAKLMIARLSADDDAGMCKKYNKLNVGDTSVVCFRLELETRELGRCKPSHNNVMIM